MRLAQIAAQNAKGFENFDYTCADVNIITGRNGTGKTSVRDLVCALFSTEGNRKLLRTGSESGYIMAVLEEDGETWTVRRDLKPGKVSEAKIKSSRAGTLGASATFLKRIMDPVAMDPLRKAMNASPKEQANILLETLPQALEQGSVLKAVDGVIQFPAKVADKIKAAEPREGLDAIRAAYDHIYETRRKFNGDAETKRTFAGQLRDAVKEPPNGSDWGAEADRKDRECRSLEDEKAGAERDSLQQFHREKETAEQSHRGRADEIDKDIDAKIEALERERKTRTDASRAQSDKEVEAARESQKKRDQDKAAELDPKIAALRSEAAVARDRATKAAEDRRTIANAETAEREAAQHEEQSQKLTDALKRLKGLETKLLETLPIPGLKIEGGAAYLNGVPLEEVNTAEQVKFWVKVMVRRAIDRDLGVIVVDDAEHLDDINFPTLVEGAKRSGMQFFICKMEPHEFRIEAA